MSGNEVKNNLIEYISQYGPSYNNDAKYDETIKETLSKLQVKPFAINTEYSKKLREIFFESNLENIRNIILTGTAGDGKTYLSHKIFDEAINKRGFVAKNHAEWNQEIIPISGKSNDEKEYTLIFIKDLSELNPENKVKVFKDFIESLINKSNIFYIICANDGKLVNTLHELHDTQNEEICKEIEDMLVNEEKISAKYNINMYNLSRLDSAKHWIDIVDAVTMHEDWNKCNECAHVLHCPIQINRKRLLSKKSIQTIKERSSSKGSDELSSVPDYAKGIFVDRIYDILSASNKNDQHLPIRHIFALVANILLGTSLFRYSTTPSKSSMDCQSVYEFFEKYERIAKKTSRGENNQRIKFGQPFQYEFCSPYDNAVGLNLTNGEDRKEFLAFPLIASFGIGTMSTEIIDRFLIYGSEDTSNEAYQKLMRQDEFFGDIAQSTINPYLKKLKIKNELYEGTVFNMAKKSYIDPDVSEDSKIYDLIPCLTSQRRRLFFSMPEDEKIFSPWRLTWYPSTKKYLHFVHLISTKNNQEESADESFIKRENYKREIYRSLNRIFTGVFVTGNCDTIYVPELSKYNKRSIYLKTQNKSCLPVQTKINNTFKSLDIALCSSGSNNVPKIEVTLLEFNMINPIERILEKKDSFKLTLKRYQFLEDVNKGDSPLGISDTIYEEFQTLHSKYEQLLNNTFKINTSSKNFFKIELQQGNINVQSIQPFT